jgi:acyl dehydratase
MALVGVAGVGLADGVGGLIGEEGCGEMLVEGKQEIEVRGFADGGMVDDHEVEAGGEVCEGRVGELLERALVPGDGDVGVEFREALSRGDHGDIAAGVVPGDAGEFSHRLDDKLTGYAECATFRRSEHRIDEWECGMTSEMFFEDFVAGAQRETVGRTITEADVVLHAGQTGDFYPHHMDAEWCKTQPFGQRMAHGTLIFSVGVGMTAGVINPRAMSYGYDRLRFVRPVFINDTIHVRVTIKEMREDAKRPKHGVVVEGLEVINQRGETVLVAEHLLLVEKRG